MRRPEKEEQQKAKQKKNPKQICSEHESRTEEETKVKPNATNAGTEPCPDVRLRLLLLLHTLEEDIRAQGPVRAHLLPDGPDAQAAAAGHVRQVLLGLPHVPVDRVHALLYALQLLCEEQDAVRPRGRRRSVSGPRPQTQCDPRAPS